MATDRELLLAALAGADAAATELLTRHLPMLTAVAQVEVRRRFDGRVDADDIVQELCVKLCRDRFRVLSRWQGLEDPTIGSIEPYLRAALANQILDAARARYRHWRREVDDPAAEFEGLPDGSAEHAVILAAEELRAALWACIERLSERRRDVIRLLAEGLTHEVIARRLRIEANASRARLHQALSRLEACLKAAGHHTLADGSV